ncbi:MAG: hypothetical protein RRY34_09540 [Victivallaceae bacterium]
MSDENEIIRLKNLAFHLNLDGIEILDKYKVDELSNIYNGIGPDAFPEWLRKGISFLHPSLAVLALIHDVEWFEGDYSKASFTASNERFKSNGYKVAKAKYAWYNPVRYVVMNQARRFGNLCQLFGWENYLKGNKKIK